jgi:hypothetical protein
MYPVSQDAGDPAMVYYLRGYSLLQTGECALKEEEHRDFTSFLPDIRYWQGN